MKNIIIALTLMLFVAPIAVSAHSGDAIDTDTGFGMMRMIEDQALGDDLHEEMEDLMVKMMSGSSLSLTTSTFKRYLSVYAKIRRICIIFQ